MKRVFIRNKYFLFFVLFTIIIFGTYYNNFYLAVDGQFHFSRINSLITNTNIGLEKQWIYSDLLNGFGYEMGIFYPDILLYPIIFIAKIFNLSVKSAYILTFVSMHIMSYIAFYYSIKYIMINENKYKFKDLSISALVYSIFPYKIVNYFIKMRVGENFIYIFIPIVILGLYTILKQKKYPEILAVGVTGVAYSNLLSVIAILFFILLITLFYIKHINRKTVFLFLKSAVLTILLSSVIIFPVIEALINGDYFIEHYPKVFGWIFQNTIPLKHYHTNIIISPIITVIVFYFIFRTINNNKNYNEKLLAFALLMLFVSTNLFPWSLLETAIPKINILQFPWRFLSFTSIPFSLLVGTSRYRKIILVPLYVGLTLLTYVTITNLHNTIPFEQTLSKFENIYTTQVGKGEYLPQKFRNYIVKEGSVQKVNRSIDSLKNDIINNQITITGENEYEYTSSKNEEIELPMLYTRNYKIKVNELEVNYTESKNGLISIIAPFNNGKIKIDYIWTKIQIISYLISIFTITYVTLKTCCYKKLSNKTIKL